MANDSDFDFDIGDFEVEPDTNEDTPTTTDEKQVDDFGDDFGINFSDDKKDDDILDLDGGNGD
jgi:hypothetical protein